MTQEQAAGKLGVARQTLSSYESGRTRPDIDMLVRLCGIYETDLDGMIYGQNRTLKAVQRVKKTAVRILILLIGLTLVSSSLLWSANHFFPVAEGWLTSAEQAVFESHRRLTGAWEAADKTILALSLLGVCRLADAYADRKVCRALEAKNTMALPHNSARADWREDLCLKKAQNRRNTLCIARFCDAFVQQIGRRGVRGELCGDALYMTV